MQSEISINPSPSCPKSVGHICLHIEKRVLISAARHLRRQRRIKGICGHCSHRWRMMHRKSALVRRARCLQNCARRLRLHWWQLARWSISGGATVANVLLSRGSYQTQISFTRGPRLSENVVPIDFTTAGLRCPLERRWSYL